MTDDLLSTPMTAHERALVLAGVEWMRAAAIEHVRPPQGRLIPAASYDEREACADYIAAIPPPSLQPARIGVLGEG